MGDNEKEDVVERCMSCNAEVEPGEVYCERCWDRWVEKSY